MKVLSCWSNLWKMNSYPHCTHLLHYLKIKKNGQLYPSILHTREPRGKLPSEPNQRTCWDSARTSEHPACALASTLQVITTVKYHSCHLRVYSWRCPTKQMDSGEFALSSHPKPSKKQSAAHAAEAKSYRTHIICARGLALPSGLVLQNSGCRTGWCH